LKLGLELGLHRNPNATAKYITTQLQSTVTNYSYTAAPTACHDQCYLTPSRRWFTYVHFMSPGLLQLVVLRHHQRSDEPSAVCSECGCTFGVGRSTLWPHNAGATGAALASDWASSGFQDGHPGLLVKLSLSGMAPPYLAVDCQLVSDVGRHQLRSANSRTCIVRWTHSSYGDRCFAAAGPRLWNSLPAHLRQTDINFEQFKRLLKTFLFSCW